jgi:hypothetical protein
LNLQRTRSPLELNPPSSGNSFRTSSEQISWERTLLTLSKHYKVIKNFIKPYLYFSKKTIISFCRKVTI